MKQFLIGLLITVTIPAWAGDRYHGHRQYHHYHHHHRHQNYNWVAPLVIGGIVGAVIANETQRPAVQQPPVVIYHSNPPVETVVINGDVYVKQYVLVNGQYREVLVRQ